jgi:pimeloyl-ACP methyl ester carboxylesterase
MIGGWMDHIEVNVRGLRFSVQRRGQGEPFVLLHGLASTRKMFALVAPLLEPEYTVIAPDQRGHGESDKPAGGYDFESICADLDGLAEALGIRTPFRLAGHSWGAYTALHYAATRPHAVSRLFLIDGGVASIRDRFGATWEEAEAKMAPHSFDGVTRDMLEQFIRERWLGAAFRPELLPLALSIFDTSNPAQVRAHLPREQHLQIVRALWEYAPLADFTMLRIPARAILAVQDTQRDPVNQASADAAQEACPSLEVRWLNDTIHDVPWQRPRELAALLRP